MKWFIQDRILHGVYEKGETVPNEVEDLAIHYEGVIPKRTGWNMPMSVIQRHATKDSPLRSYLTKADYVIVYCKNDIQTKKHELLHAKYAMDPTYRTHVAQIWATLTNHEQERIRYVLQQLKYPDDPVIQLDEFQAYYYTEKPSFFGVSVHPLRK
jgi:tartrate dehydratase beta subunit/fumarate hydratase class I family protein